MNARGAVAALVACVAAAACSTPTRPVEPSGVGPGSTELGQPGFYVLTLPDAGWRRSEPPTDVAYPPDLALDRFDGAASLFVFTRAGLRLRLEDVVAARRSAMLGPATTGWEERRYFLASEDSVPASMARYVANGAVFLVLTALRDGRSVEAVGVCAEGSPHERELLAMLESLRMEPQGS